ncbi:unnamed protein product [Sphagnum jensenii]|jgi:hypothetical protein
MPPDGGIVLPEDVPVKPFLSKSNLNSSLNVRVLVGAMGSDGFPGGHADLNDGHLGLMENPFEGVLVTEVPLAPLGLKVVEKKTTEDVKRLPKVSEAVDMVGVESGGVIFMFDGSLPEQDEGLGESRVLGHLPVFLDPLECLPSALHGGTIKQAVLGRFRGP